MDAFLRFATLLFLLCTSTLMAQDYPCGTTVSENYLDWMRGKKPQSRQFQKQFHKAVASNPAKSGQPIINSVPIKIHIVRNSNGSGGLSSSALTTSLDILNQDFRSVGLSFYKCGSTNYINNTTWYDLENSEFDAIEAAHGETNIINIYFVNGLIYNGSNTCGLAWLPGGPDRIIIKNSCSATSLSHEMGHYLGLLHTHGYSNSIVTNEFVDGSNCSEAGDFFCDTPADPSMFGKVNSSCIYTGTAKDNHGDTYAPDVENIMGYALDQCRQYFTQEQKDFMLWVYFNERHYLTCNTLSLNFTVNPAGVCSAPFNVQFTNTSVGFSNRSWDMESDGIEDYSTSNPSHTYNLAGTYYVHLSATKSGTTYHKYKPLHLEDATSVPALQAFNASALPNNWLLFDRDNARHWELLPVTGINGTTTNALTFRNHGYLSYREVDGITTEAYNLNGINSARVVFDKAYAPGPNNDGLVIYASTDCGETYPHLIYSAYGNDLATHPKLFSEFIPTANDWATEMINIDSLTGNFVRFKIINVGRKGNNLHLDNFRVEGDNNAQPTIGFVTNTYTVAEGNPSDWEVCRGYKLFTIPLQISNAPPSVVSVTISATGTAVSSHDFELLTNTIQFPSGSSQMQNIILKIYDDNSAEGGEYIDLSFSINTSGYAVANAYGTCRININDNDEIDPINQQFTNILLFEQFNQINSVYPAGWTLQKACPSCNSFFSWFNTSVSGWLHGTKSLDSTNYMIIASQYGYTGQVKSDYLITPVINASNYDSLVLEFDQVYENLLGQSIEKCVVEVWDGNAWQRVMQHTETDGNIGEWYYPDHATINIGAHANSQLQIRFGFVDALYELWWVIDNVKLTGYQTGATVASTLNQTSAVYLGPNSIVNVYDSVTNEVFATIENNSSWNYGCTTFSIDRAGNGSYPFDNTLAESYATAKTLYINPTNNNPTGSYIISLYFSTNEVNGWETSTGNTASQMEVLKTGGPFSNVTPSSPLANGNTNVYAISSSLLPFRNDWRLVGSFNAGFSGFGGAKSGNGAALPIELLEPLTAKNIPEKGNRLTWTTNIEIDNDRFEIEHSTNGHEYATIGTVNGSGNSIQVINYEFYHQDYATGTNYYRFKQIDINGNYKYSNTVYVNNSNNANFSVAVYPNPAKESLNIATGTSEPFTYKLFNAFGQTMSMGLAIGPQFLNLNELAPGIYYISIVSNDIEFIEKVIKAE